MNEFIFPPTPDTILCKAEIKAVCVDHNLRTCPLPQEIMTFLGEYV